MYKPPTRGTRRDMPYRALVAQVDPDHERAKHRVLEYAFTGNHLFFADPDRRGAFNNNSNFYPVGQPAGKSMFPLHADSTVIGADWSTATVDGNKITADEG